MMARKHLAESRSRFVRSLYIYIQKYFRRGLSPVQKRLKFQKDACFKTVKKKKKTRNECV